MAVGAVSSTRSCRAWREACAESDSAPRRAKRDDLVRRTPGTILNHSNFAAAETVARIEKKGDVDGGDDKDLLKGAVTEKVCQSEVAQPISPTDSTPTPPQPAHAPPRTEQA